MSNNNYNFTPRLDGLNNISADNIDTATLKTDTLDLTNLNATDIVCNTLTANTNIDTPSLTGAGNLDLTYVGGIYNHCADFGIDTAGGYGGITMTGQFDVILNSVVGNVILNSIVNISNSYITAPTETAGSNNTRVATTAFVNTALTNLLSATNAWLGINSFNTNLPTSTIVPTTSTQLVNKNYVDTAISGVSAVSLSGTNAWTGTNSFNTNLPTSTLTPSNGSHLTTKGYVDSAISASTTPSSTTMSHYRDDFLNGLSGVPSFMGQWAWTATTTGSVAMTGAVQASQQYKPGLWRISSIGQAGASRGYTLRQSTASFWMNTINSFEYVFVVVPSASKCSYAVNCGFSNAGGTNVLVFRYIRDLTLNPNREFEIGVNGVYTYLTGSGSTSVGGQGYSYWWSVAVTDIDNSGNLTILIRNFTLGLIYSTVYAAGTGILAFTGLQGYFDFADTTVSPVVTYTCDLDYFQYGASQPR